MSAVKPAVDLADPESVVTALLYGQPLALDDPYALYGALREQAPIHESREHDLWVLSRYTDVMAALRHPGMSMSAGLTSDPRYASSATLQMFGGSMLFCDDPASHARERRLVRQAFTRQTVQGLRETTQQLVDELLAQCAERGSFDYMGDFVEHVPVAVICRMLGVPEADIPTFAEWNFLITTGTGAVVTDEHMARVDEAALSLRAYLADLLEERRKTPGEDLLSKLIQARDGGDQLSSEETAAMAFLLLAAGSDTTAAFLGAALVALLRNPDQLRLLRERRELLPGALEELLRFEAPVHFGIMRTVTAPFALEQVEIPVGARVWTILSGGNRDPRRFEAPDRLDITRENVRHLGFAQGMHMCLGAMLARMESEVVMTSVLDRFSDLQLEQDPVPWVNHGNLRGIARLDVAATVA
ncbi:cytochrome P450 [Conexibacter sp. CPCC 206217]|uniref:cytochrome P450 n=1 Tax=Conexibacter sp. CPCC 206217 TaxID=3064574 RepID=UPI00271A6589|nr:cytochrome P450 [Conexibacter sp. CPCC 206217]MDO8212569.1 cytochrome P450 [Conexibacter sp. CPCC 206217]